MRSYNVLWIVKVLCAVFLFGTAFTTVLCGFAASSHANAATYDTVIMEDISDDMSDNMFHDEDGLHYISVTITADDTLWSIASRYRTDGSGSIKDYIRQIKHCNDMTSDFIYAGSHLVIPVY